MRTARIISLGEFARINSYVAFAIATPVARSVNACFISVEVRAGADAAVAHA
jgi:hypothetical protein